MWFLLVCLFGLIGSHSHAKESIMYNFHAMEVAPGKDTRLDVPEQHGFHLSQIVIPHGTSKAKTTVYANVDGKNFSLGTVDSGCSIFQLPTDLVFGHHQKVHFSAKGNSKVHLNGYVQDMAEELMGMPPPDMDSDDEELPEDDSEEDISEEEEVPPQKKPKLGAAKKAAPPVEEDDSEEDEEDLDDLDDEELDDLDDEELDDEEIDEDDLDNIDLDDEELDDLDDEELDDEEEEEEAAPPAKLRRSENGASPQQRASGKMGGGTPQRHQQTGGRPSFGSGRKSGRGSH